MLLYIFSDGSHKQMKSFVANFIDNCTDVEQIHQVIVVHTQNDGYESLFKSLKPLLSKLSNPCISIKISLSHYTGCNLLNSALNMAEHPYGLFVNSSMPIKRKFSILDCLTRFSQPSKILLCKLYAGDEIIDSRYSESLFWNGMVNIALLLDEVRFSKYTTKEQLAAFINARDLTETVL